MPKRKVTYLPYERIIADMAWNCRSTYDDAKIENLKDSILAEGLLQPIGVTPADNQPDDAATTVYYVTYGFRRFLAIDRIRKEMGVDAFSSIPVVINLGNSADLRVRNLRENIDREDLSPPEIATAIKKMHNAGLEQTDIAARLGRTQPWVSNMLKVATKLTPTAWSSFNTGELSIEQALSVADLPEEVQDNLVARVAGADTRKEARDITKQAAKEHKESKPNAVRKRPSMKNLATYISDVSFDATGEKEGTAAYAFYNGIAAGIKVALGTLDIAEVGVKSEYLDVNFHNDGVEAKTARKKGAPKKEAPEES